MKLTSNIQPSTFNAQCPARPPGSSLEVEGSLLPVSPSAPGRASRATRRSERGIALVITLILLSVTLVMAIAFLAVSRRERGSVTTSTDTTIARLAADSALASAQAQIIANVLATNNPFDFGLLVSTNFINPAGFNSGLGNPTNINYEYDINGNPLNNLADREQNLANLLYLPRPPVFVVTNQSTGEREFRYYLDLNRNGIFDASGDVLNVEYGLSGLFTNGLINAVGDPQWIGILERPDARYGPNNKFLARYAFIALPIGNTLDLNAIHNETRTTAVNNSLVVPPEGFFRNQGVGSWEINLAAFLADLNTNQWNNSSTAGPYAYNEANSTPTPNKGYAFEDALSLLSYRYDFNYNSLRFASDNLAANTLSGPVDIFPFVNPPMTSTLTPFYNLNLNNNRWPGADNTNHYFAIASDLFDTGKTAVGVVGTNFTQRLEMAGNGVTTYDRYTFYRLLGQLGTDSAPEQTKINLNYSNAVAYTDFNGIVTNIVFSPNAETNLVPWQPLQFFTIAANQMLREYTANWYQADPTNYLITYYGFTPVNYVDNTGYGVTNVSAFGMTNQAPAFGVTNIPVYINNHFVYSSAVQRVLQLAANMYDATTNSAFPSVFRPRFQIVTQSGFRNVYINGFEPIEFVNNLTVAPLDPPVEVTSPTLVANATAIDQFGNAYGVPWVIGAKKGLPNFNEFSMQDVVQVTRKLQVSRLTTNSLPNATNQMYVFSITNSLGVELWNSYTNSQTNSTFQVVVRDYLSMQMSNGANATLLGAPIFSYQYDPGPITVPVWPSNMFVLPLYTNVTVLSNAAYNFSGSFIPVAFNPSFANVATTPALVSLPQTYLFATNWLQVFMVSSNHVIDYVNFTGPTSTRNLNSEFQNTNTAVTGNGDYYTNLIWSTALKQSGIPVGAATQIQISDASDLSIRVDKSYWKNAVQNQIDDERNGFAHFLNPLYSTTSTNYLTDLAVQVPYTPTATIYEYTTWQANDPLVHYLKSDLNYSGYDPDASSGVQTGVHKASPLANALPILPDLGKINAHYQPWGKLPPAQTGVSQAIYDQSPYNLAFKDPQVKRSDDWHFPTNKLPTVGWIGRVHRGTPWQTVYLKASNILRENNTFGNIGTNTWAVWTGGSGNVIDAVNTAPLQDRLLFDVFTTALNDNATHGRLSINVAAGYTNDLAAGLAAWSAVFSGAVAITNSTPYPQFPQFQPITNSWLTIDPAGPAGTNSALGRLVVGINSTRATFTNVDGVTGSFEHVGDILATPQFTQQSPFLNTAGVQVTNGISDEVYEWLPQQTMSLLTVSSAPRYVIYSYGQTLTPAPNSELTSGGAAYFGMITNYQVVSEIVTRSVVQFNPVITRDAGGNLKTNYNAHVEQFNILPPD